MRITRHGNDLLVTDQSLGLGAFVLTLGVFSLVAVLARLADGQLLSLGTAAYALAGVLLVSAGLRRLVATQIIIDPDDRLVITKHWSFAGTNIQRIPFAAVTGFAILPEGEAHRTDLVIRTTRGDVVASAGRKGARAAWEEVIAALDGHMRAGPGHG